jgi:hypothetical protein
VVTLPWRFLNLWINDCYVLYNEKDENYILGMEGEIGVGKV